MGTKTMTVVREEMCIRDRNRADPVAAGQDQRFGDIHPFLPLLVCVVYKDDAVVDDDAHQ